MDALFETYPPPRVTADGWLVFDRRAGSTVAGVEMTAPRPIASLAKLMTALVVVDRIKPDTLVEVPSAINSLGGDAARMDARVGERWHASELLRATLAHSANDAALSLALHVADDEAAFVELMNERARELGLERTSFGSATGLDLAGRTSTSTPQDMTELAIEALRNEDIAAAVAEREVALERPNGTSIDPLPNRNPLLGTYDGVDGVKTGFTLAAGYMLVTHHVDERTGGDLIVTTFASDSEKTRASDTRALLDWARPLRQEVLIVEGGMSLGAIPVRGSRSVVKVFACDDLHVDVRVGQHPVQEAVVPRVLHAPIAEGDEVGTLRVRTGAPRPADDEDPEAIDVDLSEVPICAGTDVAKLEGWERFVEHARDVRGAWQAGVDEVRDIWDTLTGAA